ncbi:uncharacterized protein PgNI_12175 [Pyricularia grisea]|uniref:BTB domain-containing protein n=1 Tax=Pyricularia grisea TaxID=148305 RepID=A0A6P8AQA1_PYRGI|nr:uncharacterized protein PgNI_12175 [Pyricularia grisea]TLD04245.1 hypothetical protein PgNI_12175 [Pyricularia grisea]
MDTSPEQALRDSLKSLRISGNYSDITIVCGHDTYHVHKAIMCPRSKYFEISFKADMQENRTSCIDLSDHNTDAVKLVIDFFYLTDYEPLHKIPAWGFEIKKKPTNFEFPAAAIAETDDITAEREDPPAEPEVHNPLEERLVPRKDKKKKKKKKGKSIAMDEPAGPSTENPDSEPISLAESLLDKTFLLTHCHVYALAEYLQIGNLKVLAAGKFRAEAEKQWNHPNFFEAVQEVYRTSVRSDRLLRDIVIDIIKRRNELLDRFKYQDVVSQFDLVFELLMAVKTRGWG